MIKRIVKVFVILIIVLFFIVLFLGGTNTGLKLCFKLAKQAAPGLTATQVEGRLFGDMRFASLQYQDDGMHAMLKKVDLSWRPFALLGGRLIIEHLKVQRIHLQTYKVKAQQKPQPAEKSNMTLSLPFNFSLHHIRIGKITYDSPGNAPIVIQAIALDAISSAKKIDIKHLVLQSNPNTVKLAGVIGLKPGEQTALTGAFNNQTMSDQPLVLNFRVSGDIHNMLQATIKTPAAKQLQLKAVFAHVLTALEFKVNAAWQDFIWTFHGGNIIESKRGKLEASGSLQQYIANTNLDLSGTNVPSSQWQLKANGNKNHLILTMLKASLLQGHLSLSGEIDWAKALAWQATLKTEHLNPGRMWPDFVGDISADIESHGSYDQALSATVNIARLEGSYQLLPLKGRGSLKIQRNQYQFNQLSLSQGNNKLTLNGQISAHSNLTWQIHLPNIAAAYPEFEGAIQSQGVIRQSLSRPEITMQTQIKNLRSDYANIGQLSAKGTLNLLLSKPSNFVLDGHSIHVLHHHTKTLSVRIDTQNRVHQLFANMQVKDESIRLQAQAKLENHVIKGRVNQLTVLMPKDRLWQLRKAVEVTASHTLVTVSDFCVKNKAADGYFCGGGQWFQDKPWTFYLKSHLFEPLLLNPLLGDNFNIKADIDANAKATGRGKKLLKASALVQLQNANLQYLVSQVPKGVQFGKSALTASFDPAQGVKASLQLNTQDKAFPITATFAMPNYRGVGLPGPTQAIEGKLDLNWPNLSNLKNSVPLLSNAGGKLLGTLKLSGTLRKPVLNGQVQLDNGSASIDSLGLFYKAIMLSARVEKNNLRAKLSLQSSFLQSAKVKTNKMPKVTQGSLSLQANLTLLDPRSVIRVIASGQNFTVFNTASYAIQISPALTAEITPESNDINGTLLLPYVRITPIDFTSTQTLPGSFHVMRGDEAEHKAPKSLQLDVKVSLGQEVYLAYAGLSSSLEGSLKLSSDPRLGIIGDGAIHLKKGRFAAYGKRLEIKTGELSYNDTPIADPYIHLTALKKVPIYNFGSSMATVGSSGGASSVIIGNHIVVGVKAQGQLSDLQISLYSEPPMSETDQLSYLLFDQPASAVGGAGLLLSQAAGAIAGGDSTGEDIEKKAGLSTFGVQSSTVYMPGQAGPQAATSFVIGKKLTKSLEALYSVGLDVPITVAMLRYNWAQHWQLVARTSTFGQGGDVVYTYETDHLF